jgi:hypothetical protein
VDDNKKKEFLSILKKREKNMTPNQLKRLKKVYKALESL